MIDESYARMSPRGKKLYWRWTTVFLVFFCGTLLFFEFFGDNGRMTGGGSDAQSLHDNAIWAANADWHRKK